ncbi:hypothetical protein DC366_07630 [Pelagivirga sediminicola]|uniref:Hedgehog/Intein (Hint) domain-containing protein n=1 Tax=Pelagivirga sediminicola TaxID=2170575 RepID=A0A2T7G8K4_9RHOB|nr:hypothetical protein DC366_07630 [Pelagivirga sediminicola]
MAAMIMPTAAPGTKYTMVPAVKLVDRPGIRRMRRVAQAEYYNILLDRHSVLDAEGMLVESLLVTLRSQARLPDSLRRQYPNCPAMRPAHAIGRTAAGLDFVPFDSTAPNPEGRPENVRVATA